MRTIIAGNSFIMLGIQGENDAEVVQFPVVKEWKELYGEGIFQLANIRPDEDIPYACVLTTTDENVEWTITNTETANVGNGYCELYYFVGETLATTYRWETRVLKSIVDVGDTPPEPWESWVADVLKAGSQAQQSEVNAKESEVNAKASELAAASSEQNADIYRKDSEAWAVGTRGGADVDPADETYENNSKYYAAKAEASVAAGQYFGFFIDDDGELYVTKTPDSENLDFQVNVDTGHLEVIFS